MASQPTAPAQRAPTQAPSATDLGALTTKELAKKSLNLAEKQKLSGPDNYQHWYQAISIQFRALGIPTFLQNPDPISASLSDAQKAVLLMSIRDTLKDGPLSTITFETDPRTAYKHLVRQYAPTQTTLQDTLYRDYHNLRFDGSLTVVDFNAKFNTLVFQLRTQGVNIEEIDQINHYFNVLESHFST